MYTLFCIVGISTLCCHTEFSPFALTLNLNQKYIMLPLWCTYFFMLCALVNNCLYDVGYGEYLTRSRLSHDYWKRKTGSFHTSPLSSWPFEGVIAIFFFGISSDNPLFSQAIWGTIAIRSTYSNTRTAEPA